MSTPIERFRLEGFSTSQVGSFPRNATRQSPAMIVTASVPLTAGITSVPVTCCSHMVTTKVTAPSPASAKNQGGPMPSRTPPAISIDALESPSRPWSSSSPMRLVCPLRRARAPSTLSAVRYPKKSTEPTRYPAGTPQRRDARMIDTADSEQRSPSSEMALGATESGIRASTGRNRTRW